MLLWQAQDSSIIEAGLTAAGRDDPDILYKGDQPMKIFSFACVSVALGLAAFPVASLAQDGATDDGLTLTGSAAVVSDYRFRGFSQSNEKAAIQGGLTISHDSGFYVGTWGSSIGFANGTEPDVFAGYSKEIRLGVTADVGLMNYFYPGASQSTILEPYASVTGDLGPASLKAGVAWAPSGQSALDKKSALYLYSDVGIGITNRPITLKGHIGYAKNDSALGGLDGDVWDYAVGMEFRYKMLTLGLSYVNSDASKIGGFKEAAGVDGAVIFSLGASF